MTWHSAIYEGWVRHRRYFPTPHAFRYSLFLMYLDLDELSRLFKDRWFWANESPAYASFRRADHFGDPRQPLAESVRDLVQQRFGHRPAGPVRLLTHLRYLGYAFNPVSVYFCYDLFGERLESVVFEVTNTPWNERHCYVFDARDNPNGRRNHFAFPKVFHVSPFLGMDMQYDFHLLAPGKQLLVHMDCSEANRKKLDATLALKRTEITPAALGRILWKHPCITGKVTAAIYGEAIRLWLKKCPAFPHPQPPAETHEPDRLSPAADHSTTRDAPA